MMHGHEKSDPAIVADEAGEQSGAAEHPRGRAAESVERRAGTKGNADQQSTCRTQSRHKRVTGAGTHTATSLAVTHPRWEKLWGGRRRSWHLHRPYELMEIAPWPKSMISAEA